LNEIRILYSHFTPTKFNFANISAAVSRRYCRHMQLRGVHIT
jgi:hypothetical protein